MWFHPFNTHRRQSFFQAGDMAFTSQAFQTIAAEGSGFQVRKMEAQQEQEQNRVRVVFSCPGKSKLSPDTKMSGWCPACCNRARLTIGSSEAAVVQASAHPVQSHQTSCGL